MSGDQVMEEAYQYLELDHPERLENKKKGVILSYLNNGDPLYKTRIGAMPGFDATGQSVIRMGAKLRNFTEEQK